MLPARCFTHALASAKHQIVSYGPIGAGRLSRNRGVGNSFYDTGCQEADKAIPTRLSVGSGLDAQLRQIQRTGQ